MARIRQPSDSFKGDSIAKVKVPVTREVATLDVFSRGHVLYEALFTAAAHGVKNDPGQPIKKSHRSRNDVKQLFMVCRADLVMTWERANKAAERVLKNFGIDY